MISYILGTLLLIFSSVVSANSIKEEALKFIPGGTVVHEKAKEIKVKTPQGSIVEVEFDSSGKFEEASGDDLEKDIFNPGNDLFSLQTIRESLKKQGKDPVADWSLEHSLLLGWHYELKGYEKGQKFDYIVDAKTGKLVESKLDD